MSSGQGGTHPTFRIHKQWYTRVQHYSITPHHTWYVRNVNVLAGCFWRRWWVATLCPAILICSTLCWCRHVQFTSSSTVFQRRHQGQQRQRSRLTVTSGDSSTATRGWCTTSNCCPRRTSDVATARISRSFSGRAILTVSSGLPATNATTCTLPWGYVLYFSASVV